MKPARRGWCALRPELEAKPGFVIMAAADEAELVLLGPGSQADSGGLVAVNYSLIADFNMAPAEIDGK